MAVVIWAGQRQLKAIRGSFATALTQGSAHSVITSDDLGAFERWVEREELTDIWNGLSGKESISKSPEHGIPSLNMSRFITLWGFVGEMLSFGDFFSVATIKEGTRTTQDDFGAERSSAHWDRWENFLTTSAMLRFLGALEQFELDTLKCLFYYRPLGRGTPVEELEDVEVAEDVVREQPEIRDKARYYQKPSVWTWICRPAENNSERRMIYSRVYDLKLDTPDRQQLGWTFDELYDKRNAIAHGRESVYVTVGQLMKVHRFVSTTMLNTRDKVYERYRIQL